MTNKVSMVIGSWGSYNERNDRALGSKWLDFDYFDDWDEIVEELKKEGFELDGIDEELFVQDIEGVPDGKDWDYVHPRTIFELIKKSGVLDDEYNYELMLAFCETESFDKWARLVEEHERNWDRDIVFYRNMTILDVAYELIDECFDLEETLGQLSSYFDYSAFARDLSYEGYIETEYGVLVIQ